MCLLPLLPSQVHNAAQLAIVPFEPARPPAYQSSDISSDDEDDSWGPTMDYDMAWYRVYACNLPTRPDLEYIISQVPRWRIVPERPACLQLVTWPMGIFYDCSVEDPERVKAQLCQALWMEGVEQPIPTPRGSPILALGQLKVPSFIFVRACRRAALRHVFIGKHGQKTPIAGYEDLPPSLRSGYTAVDMGFMWRASSLTILLMALVGWVWATDGCGIECLLCYLAIKTWAMMENLYLGHWRSGTLGLLETFLARRCNATPSATTPYLL